MPTSGAALTVTLIALSPDVLQPSSATTVKPACPAKPASGVNRITLPSGATRAVPCVTDVMRSVSGSFSGSVRKADSEIGTSRSTCVNPVPSTAIGAWFGT